MTFADMVLAHAILEKLGPDCINLVLDILEGDTTLHPYAIPILTDLVRTLEYELKAVLMPLRMSPEVCIQA